MGSRLKEAVKQSEINELNYLLLRRRITEKEITVSRAEYIRVQSELQDLQSNPKKVL